jgi:hypothetical protein
MRDGEKKLDGTFRKLTRSLGRSHVEVLSPSEYSTEFAAPMAAPTAQLAWKNILFSRVIYVEETYGTIRWAKMKVMTGNCA